MLQNIYFCEVKGASCGSFVIASTRKRAKELYSDVVGCSIFVVRTHIFRRGINEMFSFVIDSLTSPFLQKYELNYSEKGFVHLHISSSLGKGVI